MGNKKIIYFVLVLIWIVIVFLFSNQDGDKSNNTSNSIFTNNIVKIINKNFSNSNDIEIRETVNLVVRKIAHFSIYFIGGILIFKATNSFKLNIKYKILITVILGILYASLDEMHQIFVPGRTAQVRDIIIDVSGFMLAVLIESITIRKKERKERWKN